MSWIPSLFSLCTLVCLAACGMPDGPRVDSRNDAAFQDGANSVTNPCVRESILDFTNDSETSIEDLKIAGLHSQAAKNIVHTRNGQDGEGGTSDDVIFTSLQALDRVPYVGPVAMEALLRFGESVCDGTAGFNGEACFVSESLRIVSNQAVSSDTLRANGLPTRGAKAIVAARNGEDGAAGTADDVVFSSMSQLDAVPQVGEVTLDAVRELGVSVCEGDGTSIFSPQQYEQSHLAEVKSAVDSAHRTIDIAMYSFRDTAILNALGDAVERGVEVRVVFESAATHRKDPEGTWSAALEHMGIEVRWINKIMHHKYAIIDGPRTRLADARSGLLINGSGNWSYSAGTRYDENTVFIEGDEKLLLSYQAEFNLLWENGRDLVWNEDIQSGSHLAITPLDIERADGSDALFTSANFRTYESSTYGPTFSVDKDSRVVSDALVALIQSAEKSIYVASGHMRSRAVAEALISKRASNPNVDIRVYLDGQEYISDWYHNKQLDEVEDCLEEAGTDTERRQDCLDEGYYFGLALDEADVNTRYKYYSYRWHYSYAEQMHHKTILVDETFLATGSYNFSNNAEHNTMENVAVFHVDRYPTLIGQFRRNFDMMWLTGASEDRYNKLWRRVSDATKPDVPIVFDSMALDWSEITALKGLIRKMCPSINDEELREHPEDHWVCEK